MAASSKRIAGKAALCRIVPGSALVAGELWGLATPGLLRCKLVCGLLRPDRSGERIMAQPRALPSLSETAAAAANWRQTLWAMVAVQFVMTMSFSMLTPIMPLFLPVLGVNSERAVDLWAGVLAGVTSFVAAFASPLWGRLADRHGRKLMLLRSSIAVVAGQAPEDRLGYALGWLSTGQLVGSLVGPLLGGGLADLTGSFRIPFFCTAATILVSSVYVWFGVHERFVAAAPGRGRRALLNNLIAVARSPGLLALFFVLLMAQFGVRTVQPVVTLSKTKNKASRPGERA